MKKLTGYKGEKYGFELARKQLNNPTENETAKNTIELSSNRNSMFPIYKPFNPANGYGSQISLTTRF